MYLNNLKKLRMANGLTQKEISNKIGVNVYTYINWERNIVVVPLLKIDKLSLYYKTSLSYILGITKKYEFQELKPLNYDKLLNNLSNLKLKHNHSCTYISIHLNCSRAQIIRYFNGTRNIPVDKLIELAEFYKIDLDELCGKKEKV